MDKSNNLPSTRPQDIKNVESVDLYSDFMEIEKERIDSANKRTEVARLVAENNDKSDSRLYSFNMERLRIENEDKIRRHSLSRYIFSSAILIFISITSLLLYMVFFGSSDQSVLAQDLLQYFLIGLGGYGLISGLVGAAKSIINKK